MAIRLETFSLELLDSLYYNSLLDSGASGTALTVPWIGDLALMYAVSKSLGIGNLSRKLGHTPHYEEVADLPFVTSVGHSMSNVKMLPIYDFSTSFISEGYMNDQAFEDTKNAPFRNWIRKQGIAPGNVFYFSVAYRDSFSLPDAFTIRLGNMRSCLARVLRLARVPDQYDVWGNLYTASLISRKWNGDRMHVLPEGVSRELLSAYYAVIKGLDGRGWLDMVDPYE